MGATFTAKRYVAAAAPKVASDTGAEAIVRIAKAAHAIGWQAGVGGMETAGAIVSYLAAHPERIAPFLADEESPVDWPDFVHGGCLTWHAQKGGKIIDPAEVRAAQSAPREGPAV